MDDDCKELIRKVDSEMIPSVSARHAALRRLLREFCRAARRISSDTLVQVTHRWPATFSHLKETRRFLLLLSSNF